MSNQLLFENELPNFSKFKVEDIGMAVEERLQKYKAVIDTVKTVPNSIISWDNTIALLDEADANLNATWSMISHLNAVCHSETLQVEHDKYEQIITEFSTSLGQDQKLYNIYKILETRSEQLSPHQYRAVNLSLLDFELSGIALAAAQKNRLKQLLNNEVTYETQFSVNVLKATQEWTYVVENIDQISGLPKINIEIAKEKAKDKNISGWLITLDAPCYQAVMTYATNRKLRELMYRASATRCSELSGDARYNNAPIIESLMELRKEFANILGYDNYAEYALAKNMAKDTSQVMEFLQGLLGKAKQTAREQMQAVVNYAEKDGVTDFKPWDFAFYAEKQQQNIFKFSSEEIKQYFIEEKVWSALFNLVHNIFAIKIVQEPSDLWDEHAKLFVVYDDKNEVIGRFYTDLYAREGKRQGAWMSDLLTKYKKTTGQVENPLAFLVTNFTGPTLKTPSLLSHDEVITLFHEFGHTIHHLLSTIDVYNVSGGHGVAWDAIELPSQFMENWCWEWDVIKDMSCHYETGKPMPKELFDKLLSSKCHNAGVYICRQLEFALFDEKLHIQQDGQESKVQKIIDEIRIEIDVFPHVEFNKFQNSFSHIFAGGYSANYYSYLWAEMLSTDAFAMFKETGLLNLTTAAKFRKYILSAGGSRPMEELYFSFRGREPNDSALLEEYGIT